MFGTDKSISSLQELFSEAMHYLSLQKENIQLQVAEKLIVLLSTVILAFSLIAIGMITLFFLSLTLAGILETLIGVWPLAYALVGGCIALMGASLYWKRERFIVRPLSRFIGNLLLKH